jgi:DNA repair exonuclease SbcCD ATPase subunit
MELFISGYLEEDALEQGYGAATGATVTWLNPDDFVERCRTAENSRSDQHWIWLYRGPWSLAAAPLDISADQQFIRNWSERQRVLLKLRHELPTTVLLVNRDTTTAHELFSALGLQPLPTNAPIFHDQVDLTTALGKLFEWIDPYCWEVFEALEATALITTGNPLFRNRLAPPPPETLHQIATLLKAGRRLPEAEQELTEQRQTVNDLQNELNDLKQENELLLLQLHQVQEELEKLFVQKSDQSDFLEEENKKLTQIAAQAKQECQILERKLTELSTAQKKSADTLKKVQQANTNLLAEKEALAERITEIEQRAAHELKGLQDENELLLLQLHQVQEELESYFLAGQQMGATLTRSQHTMDQARLLLCRLALQK